jgi:acyl carrier protein phosphodiesterase
MNYLAHAYLSFGDPDVLLGNMISDFVKGKKKFDYPESIRVGIELHRAIDHFTDTHSATKNIASLFKPAYRLYGGAFADIVYDYFLANDPQEFESESALLAFTLTSYGQLEQNAGYFPEVFAHMFPYMRSQNWLYNYRQHTGIQKSFQGLARRAAYIPETETAYQLFLENKDYFREQYQHFFRSVKIFAADTLRELQNP